MVFKLFMGGSSLFMAGCLVYSVITAAQLDRAAKKRELEINNMISNFNGQWSTDPVQNAIKMGEEYRKRNK